MFLKDLLKTKTVSVWGLGYLGYTTILKLQNSGFNVVAYDLTKEQLNQFKSGNYPTQSQINSWSRLGYVPKLDYSRVKVAKNFKELFKSSYLHIIAIPESPKNSAKNSVASQLSNIFFHHLKRNSITPLIIFESAFIPGHIEKRFVESLKQRRVICGRNYLLGALFRTDWNTEAFVNQKDKMPIAGYCQKSLAALREVLDYLRVSTVELKSIKEAEIYVNSLNAIQAMASNFVRQLSLGYTLVNFKMLSELLFNNITLEDCAMNIGTGGRRMTFAIDYLIEGSNNPSDLTLLKEFQDINISSVLNYAEYIVRRGYKSVAILGITYRGDQKDLTLSPAVILANYLIKNSVKVVINDPFCTKDEIRHLVKNAELINFPDDLFCTDAIVLASDHSQYKHVSQSVIDKKRKKTKLIIDNYGAWNHLDFGKGIKYHCPGDGSLKLLK